MNEKSGEMSSVLEKFNAFLSYGNTGTAKTYMPFLRDFLGFIEIPFDKVTSLDITCWFRHLEKEGMASSKTPLQRRTVRVGASALKRFYKAVGHPEIASMIPFPMFEAIEESKYLLEDVAFKVVGKIPVLCVAYDLALRIGEVHLLNAEMCDLKSHTIVVTREKHKGRHNKYQLTLDPWCAEILGDYLRQKQIRRGPIFPFSIPTINNIFRQRRGLIGPDGNDYTFHCLRHSRLTHIAIHDLESKGTVDLVSLAKFAGHSNVNTTLTYIHLASKYIAFEKQSKGFPKEYDEVSTDEWPRKFQNRS